MTSVAGTADFHAPCPPARIASAGERRTRCTRSPRWRRPGTSADAAAAPGGRASCRATSPEGRRARRSLVGPARGPDEHFLERNAGVAIAELRHHLGESAARQLPALLEDQHVRAHLL